jgi:hypothetical protein
VPFPGSALTSWPRTARSRARLVVPPFEMLSPAALQSLVRVKPDAPSLAWPLGVQTARQEARLPQSAVGAPIGCRKDVSPYSQNRPTSARPTTPSVTGRVTARRCFRPHWRRRATADGSSHSLMGGSDSLWDHESPRTGSPRAQMPEPALRAPSSRLCAHRRSSECSSGATARYLVMARELRRRR